MNTNLMYNLTIYKVPFAMQYKGYVTNGECKVR